MEYDFTLKFALGRSDADPEGYVEALSKSGCDDAVIGVGKPGRIALDFCRESKSAEEAVLSALADVKRAIPDARFIEATPDFVGVTDIANLIGCSRQNVAKIMTSSGSAFPEPVHDGKRPIWHLETVLTWLLEHQERHIDEKLIEVSRINMRCNYVRQESKLAQETPDQLREAVA